MTKRNATTNPGRVVELFAGVGGFRIGLERELGGFDPDTGWDWQERKDPDWSVVWGNQWEPSTKSQPAFDCYSQQFEGEGKHVNADIAEVLNLAGVPKYDGVTRNDLLLDHELAPPKEFELLVGGFPCQDYSVAKPLSQATGLGGAKGALWWEIARMLQQYRPPHVLLENVDRLLKSPSTQRGRDFAVILACFAQLGYAVEWRVINGADYGFPQRRKRVFIYATLQSALFDELGVDVDSYEADPVRWEATVARRGNELLTGSGVLASALPCALAGEATGTIVSLGKGADSIDPHDVSENWTHPRISPFRNAGFMFGGAVWTTNVGAVHEEESFTLGDMLLPIERIRAEHADFAIPTSQLDFSANPEHNTWNYLKGSKSEVRVKTVGGETFSYRYAEGAVAFPEPLDRASRTILTGEGGRAVSRFKLVVRQDVPSAWIDDDTLPLPLREAIIDEGDGPAIYRRLSPLELERLDMFPDDWTAETAPGRPMVVGRRAFCTGNALVVGIVARIGDEITRRRASEERRSSRAG